MAEIDGKSSYTEYLIEMWHCYQVFWYTTASSLVMTIIYIQFLKACAGPMLFVSISLILVFGSMAAYGAYVKV